MTVALVQLRIIGSDMLDLLGGIKQHPKNPIVSLRKGCLDTLEKRYQAWDLEMRQLSKSLFNICTSGPKLGILTNGEFKKVCCPAKYSF